jgi:hypothetical protein
MPNLSTRKKGRRRKRSHSKRRKNEDGGGIKLTEKLEDRMDSKKIRQQGKYEEEKNVLC